MPVTRDVSESGNYVITTKSFTDKNIKDCRIAIDKGSKPLSVQHSKYSIHEKFIDANGEKIYGMRNDIPSLCKSLGEFILQLKALIEDNIIKEFDDGGILIHGSFMPFFMASPIYTDYVMKCYNDKEILKKHADLYNNPKTVYKFVKKMSSRFFNTMFNATNKIVGFDFLEKLDSADVNERFGMKAEMGSYFYTTKEKWESFKNNKYIAKILSYDNMYEKNIQDIYINFRAFSEAYAEHNNGITPKDEFAFCKFNASRVRNGEERIELKDYIEMKKKDDRKAIEKRQQRIRIKNASLTQKDIERDKKCVKDRVFLKSIQGNTLRLTTQYSCVPKVDRPKYYSGYNKIDIHAAMPRLAYMISHEDYDTYDGDFYEDIAKEISGSDSLESFTGDVRKRFKSEVVKSMNIANGHYTGRQMYDDECIHQEKVENNEIVDNETVEAREILKKLFKNLNIPYDGSLDSFLKYTTSVFDEVKKICGNKRYGWFYNVLESKINLLMAEKLEGEFFHINYDEYAVKDFIREQIVDMYNSSVQTIVKEAKLENKPLNLDDAIHHTLFEPTPINKSTLCVDDDILTFKKYKDKSAVVIRQYKNYCVGMHIDDNVYYAIKGKAKDMQKMLSEIYDVDSVIATNIKGADKPLKNFIYSVQCKNIAVELHKGLCDDKTYDNLYVVEY